MVENRGGPNGGPQYSPMNISATGGAGQSGTQAPKYMPGLAQGQGQVNMENQSAAPLAGSPTAMATMASSGPAITPIDAPTRYPDRPGTYGIDAGPGAGSEALTLPAMMPQQQPDSSAKLIQALYLQDQSNEDVRRMLEYLSAEGRI